MSESEIPPIHRYITDPLFQKAVSLIDSGDTAGLTAFLCEHPNVLSDTASFSETFFVSGTQPGQYFERPKLLWFVAENPIRNNTLPENITRVIQAIVDAQYIHSADTIQYDLDYTLSLVTSGNVPRETGMRGDLVSALVRNGADPNCADAALAHGERDAVQLLLDHGARISLTIAAGMGLMEHLHRLMPESNTKAMQQALACAAVNGESMACGALVGAGADPNRHNPDGFHAHCTPLHNAVASGSLETVRTLINAGADPSIRDTIHAGDAGGWGAHMGHADVVDFLDSLNNRVSSE